LTVNFCDTGAQETWLEFFATEGTFALRVFLSAQKRHHEALSMCANRLDTYPPEEAY
jgi:hypothetical protein